MENTTAFIEITAILSDYFDGIYEGNTEKLDRVFHPAGQLSCVTDGSLNLTNKTKYLEIVANREPPESKGPHRYDKIISIDMESAVCHPTKILYRSANVHQIRWEMDDYK